MYIAELRGKLSLAGERSEDVLTSDVFSFLKYANRDVYLRRFLAAIGISDVTRVDLHDAEFIFWPSFEDRTEPDVVILVGPHYLLFEAKYLSGFGAESEEKGAQLVREIDGGLDEARAMNRSFRAIALTADPYYPQEKFADVPPEYGSRLDWINWQTISQILLDVLDSSDGEPPDALFAEDLYDLLDKRRLRGFLPFDRLAGIYSSETSESVFFAAQTASYRGAFIGYSPSLAEQPLVGESPDSLFYSRTYFRRLPRVDPLSGECLFYEGDAR